MTIYSNANCVTNDPNGNINEFGYHSHKMPDGNYAPMHSHVNGDVLHDHVVVLDLNSNQWRYDTLNDPILLADQQRLNALMGGINKAPKAPPPLPQVTTQQSTICEAKEEPEPKTKSRADTIWELLKGAAKQ